MSGSSLSDADPALEELGRELDAARGHDPLAPVTVVTPSAYAAVFVRRALAARSGTGDCQGWANVHCTTVPTLIGELGSPALAARGLRLAPPAADLEVIRIQTRQASGWLGQFSGHPSAVAEVQRALSELRRCPPDTLKAISRPPGRGRDLVGLLTAVRRELHAVGLTDMAEVTDAALAGAHATTSAPAVRGTSDRAPGALVTWQLGPLTTPESTLLRLLGARPGPSAPLGGGGATLTEVRPCSDPDEEARATVRSIVAGAEAGAPLWKQAVFHPPGATYARILSQHLAGAGVPSNGPGLRRLDRSVTGRALLGLLDLAGGDWPRAEVLGWLSAAPLTTGPGGRPVPASRWDVLSAAAGVVSGPGQWRQRLGRLAAGGGDADEAATLAVFMDELIERSRPPGGSWGALAAWAVALLDHYLRPDSHPVRWPVEEVVARHRVREVVTALADLERLSPGADLPTFRRAVRTELERTSPEPPEPGGGFGDGVFVAPYGAAAGLRMHTVHLTGLADALVPGRGEAEGLLGDDVRRRDTSGNLPLRPARREAVRRELLAAVATGRHRRVGTLPRGDPRTGRAQVATRWLPDLVGPDCAWRPVDSFARGLAGAEPVLSAREFELRALDRWVGRGGRPESAPTVHDVRLRRGFEASAARGGTRFTRFDGNVGPGRVSAFDPGTPVSATRFETYAKCPRRYLFERVLRISERIRPEELWRIEPRTRGTVVHAILEDYVAERVGGAPRSLDRVLTIATARLDEAEAGGLVGKPLLWRMDRLAIVRDLRRFHIEEGDNHPIAAELSFGDTDEDAGPGVKVVLDDGRSVVFRGSVDRVDRTPTGLLMVSDYKTGRQGRLSDLTRDPVAAGKLLQLPLYAMAALDRFGGPRPVHARYWLLSGERSAPCYHLLVTEEVEARFRQVVRTIADGVEDGCFPGVPGMPTFGTFANCTGCAFDAVCPPSRDRHWGRTYNTPELRGVVSLVNGDVPDSLAGSVVKRFVDPDVPPS